MIGTSEMAPAALQREYIDAIVASVAMKYRVCQVVGSRRRSGWLLGRGVPALVVIGSSGDVEDVYPHDSPGRYVAIAEFLANLAACVSARTAARGRQPEKQGAKRDADHSSNDRRRRLKLDLPTQQ
jgi:hypothetical protein